MTAATVSHETPVFFRSGDHELFGILSHPDGEPAPVGVVLAWGKGQFPSAGRNQARSLLARDLAAHGFSSLRFDYAGFGDSSGGDQSYGLDNIPTRDFLAASRRLLDDGSSRLAAVTHCFGGRTALLALDELPQLAAISMVAPPLGYEDHRLDRLSRTSTRDQLSRLKSPSKVKELVSSSSGREYLRLAVAHRVRTLRNRSSSSLPPNRLAPELTDAVRKAARRGVRLRWAWGEEDDFYDVFAEAVETDPSWRAMATAPTTSIEIHAGGFHGLTTLAAQERNRRDVVSWLDGVFGAPVPAGTPGT